MYRLRLTLEGKERTVLGMLNCITSKHSLVTKPCHAQPRRNVSSRRSIFCLFQEPLNLFLSGPFSQSIVTRQVL